MGPRALARSSTSPSEVEQNGERGEYRRDTAPITDLRGGRLRDMFIPRDDRQ